METGDEFGFDMPDWQLRIYRFKEELRQIADRHFERGFTEHPQLAAFAEERATALALGAVEDDPAGASHPALPTIAAAFKKLIFLFTDPTDLDATVSDYDVSTLFVRHYAISGGGLQVAANTMDVHANYVGVYLQGAQELSGTWEIMDPAQRFWYAIGYGELKVKQVFGGESR